MEDIFLTGSSGFVGRNFIRKMNSKYIISNYKRNTDFVIKEYAVIHLAGIAHDLKNTLNPNSYYEVNTNLTIDIFHKFLESKSKVFIFLSSVKAAADKIEIELTENYDPRPVTHYGKSKLLAEEYIIKKIKNSDKRIYILRPCMIHGPENKGNLNLLYNIVQKGFPWPLSNFVNQRSFCSIDNLIFILNELITNENIPSGIYNIADDETMSTNDLVKLIADSIPQKLFFLKIPKFIIYIVAYIGTILKLKINLENLQKLTENYVVNNSKIKNAINKNLPFSTQQGLSLTISSFKHNKL